MVLKSRPDGFSKILTEDADHGADEEDDGAAFVVQLEDPVVNVRLVELQILDDVTENVRHCQYWLNDRLENQCSTRSKHDQQFDITFIASK